MTGKMFVKLLLLMMLSELLLFSVSEAKPFLWPVRRRRRRRRRRRSVPTCDNGTPSGVLWENSWHESFRYLCPSEGQSLKNWRSEHRNCKEDRVHHFECKNGPFMYQLHSTNCAWSGHFENDFDHPLSFKCPHNGVITGVKSEYSGQHRDRRFGFHCCNKNDYKAHTCVNTDYMNNWDGKLDYWVPNGMYLVGVDSYHVNNKQDRRWKFEICKFSKY